MNEKSVELITGPYRAGKSMRLLRELVEYCQKAPLTGSPVILTVPSHRYKGLIEERIAAILKEKGTESGLFGLTILPFYDLCHYLLRLTGNGFRLLGDGLRPAVLIKAMERSAKEERLTTLQNISHFAGTHAQILELIDELERAALTPTDVLSTLARAAASDSRYIELARVYQAYWQELETLSVYDERKLAFKTREIIAALPSGTLGIGIFAIDGFDRLNPLQLSIFSALSKQCQRTLIAFDYMEADTTGGGAEYAWKDKSIKGLREVFGTVRETFMECSTASKAKRILSSSLDRCLEMEEVARDVKDCLLAGQPASEIVVVARSLEPYLPAIKAAFDRANVDYYLDQSVSVASLPLIKYLRRLLLLTLNDFARLEVIRTLRSPFCNLEYLGLDKNEVEQIDQRSIKNVVVQGLADWHGEESVLKLLNLLKKPADGTLSYFVGYVEDLIDQLLILPSDEEFADPLIAWEEHQALLEVRRILSELLFEDELLAPVYGETILTYQSFCARLEKTFEKANYRRPRPSKGAVTICGADLVSNRRFQTVFLTGLIEGEFPRRSERSGFLSRDEVRRWLGFGVDIENPRQHESFELSLFNSLVDRATDKLFLSYPTYQMEGEETVQSFFLNEGGESPVSFYHEPRLRAGIRPVSKREQALSLFWHGQTEEGMRKALNDLTFIDEDFALQVAEPIAFVQARTRPGAIDVPSDKTGDISEQVRLGLAKVNLPEYWSVSKLSDYGKCPFKFWVSHTLNIKALEEPSAGLDARLLGEVYHKCLELFYSGLESRQLSMLDNDIAPLAIFFDQCIKDALEWLVTSRPFKVTEFWDYEQKEIYFRLRRFFARERETALKTGGEFVPVAFEKAFGFEDEAGSASALVISTNERTVKLRGRIDRIDKANDGRVQVIDYKAGSKPISLDEARQGSNMQMPVYALAANQCIEPGAHVSSGIFLSISQAKSIGRIDFDKVGAELLPQVKEHIVNFVHGIEQGKFPVLPVDQKVCATCDHGMVCRIAELGKSDAYGEE